MGCGEALKKLVAGAPDTVLLANDGGLGGSERSFGSFEADAKLGALPAAHAVAASEAW